MMTNIQNRGMDIREIRNRKRKIMYRREGNINSRVIPRWVLLSSTGRGEWGKSLAEKKRQK
jgi:hypothetical protein